MIVEFPKMIFYNPWFPSIRITSAFVLVLILNLGNLSALLISNRNDTFVSNYHNISDLSLLNSSREGRRSVVSGGLFSIVSFDNVPCKADSGDIGTCYSPRECTNLAGTSSGICAGNYGVCCVVTPSCGNTVTTNNTYFVNPGYPSTTTGPLSCSLIVNKLAGATELYLEFTSFSIKGSTLGNCLNDTFTVLGTATNIPTLCGLNTGQMIYLDISSSAGPFTLKFTLANTMDARNWKIRIVQFKPNDACAAPFGCQMYFRTISGMIQSYNFNLGQGGEFLNNYCDNICFQLQPGYCSVILTENEFMIGGTAPNTCTTDFLLANGIKFCGDTLENGMIQINKTSSSFVQIQVCSGNSNADMNMGYNLNFTQGPCSTTG